jgi:hypothetical protein
MRRYPSTVDGNAPPHRSFAAASNRGGPPAGPGEDMGVDLFERPGASGHLVGARLLVIARDPLLPPCS